MSDHCDAPLHPSLLDNCISDALLSRAIAVDVATFLTLDVHNSNNASTCACGVLLVTLASLPPTGASIV